MPLEMDANSATSVVNNAQDNLAKPDPIKQDAEAGAVGSGTKQDFEESNLVSDKVYDSSASSGSSNVPGNDKNTLTGQMDSGIQMGDKNDYWWNQMAKDQAYNQYQQDLNNAIANSLTSRQNIEANASKAMENFFLEEYKTAQQVDKAGWSGGYLLDSDRQTAYLQATISADMYGQMELQKQGFDTQLAMARLAYESNESQLALQYYNQASQNAIAEAELTGFYIPPEAKENLQQEKLADQILNDPNSTQAQKDKATSVKAAVNSWFTSQGISKEGQKTLAMLQHEETIRANKEQERLQQLAIEAQIRAAQIAADAAIKAANISANATIQAAQMQVNAAKNSGGGNPQPPPPPPTTPKKPSGGGGTTTVSVK